MGLIPRNKKLELLMANSYDKGTYNLNQSGIRTGDNISTAINEAFALSGVNIVEIPIGIYTIDSKIDVPAGKTLRGANSLAANAVELQVKTDGLTAIEMHNGATVENLYINLINSNNTIAFYLDTYTEVHAHTKIDNVKCTSSYRMVNEPNGSTAVYIECDGDTTTAEGYGVYFYFNMDISNIDRAYHIHRRNTVATSSTGWITSTNIKGYTSHCNRHLWIDMNGEFQASGSQFDATVQAGPSTDYNVDIAGLDFNDSKGWLVTGKLWDFGGEESQKYAIRLGPGSKQNIIVNKSMDKDILNYGSSNIFTLDIEANAPSKGLYNNNAYGFMDNALINNQDKYTVAIKLGTDKTNVTNAITDLFSLTERKLVSNLCTTNIENLQTIYSLPMFSDTQYFSGNDESYNINQNLTLKIPNNTSSSMYASISIDFKRPIQVTKFGLSFLSGQALPQSVKTTITTGNNETFVTTKNFETESTRASVFDKSMIFNVFNIIKTKTPTKAFVKKIEFEWQEIYNVEGCQYVYISDIFVHSKTLKANPLSVIAKQYLISPLDYNIYSFNASEPAPLFEQVYSFDAKTAENNPFVFVGDTPSASVTLENNILTVNNGGYTSVTIRDSSIIPYAPNETFLTLIKGKSLNPKLLYVNSPTGQIMDSNAGSLKVYGGLGTTPYTGYPQFTFSGMIEDVEDLAEIEEIKIFKVTNIPKDFDWNYYMDTINEI